MKKNEDPHRLRIVFKHETLINIKSFGCSCAAGQGLCHHNISLMYTVAHYQMRPTSYIQDIEPSAWYTKHVGMCEGIIYTDWKSFVLHVSSNIWT